MASYTCYWFPCGHSKVKHNYHLNGVKCCGHRPIVIDIIPSDDPKEREYELARLISTMSIYHKGHINILTREPEPMDSNYQTGSMFYTPLYYGPNCIGSIDFNLFRVHAIKGVLELCFISRSGRKVAIAVGLGPNVVSYASGSWEIPILQMFSPINITMEGALYIGRNMHRFIHLKGDIKVDAEL